MRTPGSRASRGRPCFRLGVPGGDPTRRPARRHLPRPRLGLRGAGRAAAGGRRALGPGGPAPAEPPTRAGAGLEPGSGRDRRQLGPETARPGGGAPASPAPPRPPDAAARSPGRAADRR